MNYKLYHESVVTSSLPISSWKLYIASSDKAQGALSAEVYMMVLAYRLQPAWWSGDSILRGRIASRLRKSIEDGTPGPLFFRAYKSMQWDCDLLFWCASREPEQLADIKLKMNSAFVGVANPTHSLLSLFEESPYIKAGGDLTEGFKREPLRYFVAYPMSKSADWYQLDYEERKKIMAEHIGIARSHPEGKGIRSYTTYSYGLGDHEFVVMYETDSLTAWSHVTGALREARARKWIINETPLHLGVLLPDLMSLAGKDMATDRMGFVA